MQESRLEPFVFTGKGGEYFRIWIVNLCLTIVTLGIYSAWAKVRRMQYFYRHTSVGGANFDYHGDPVAILKGRLIALVLFGLYSAAGHIGVGPWLAALALLLAVMPWLLVRSFRFRMHNTSYRGLRFAFFGKNGEGYINFLLLPLLSYVTLGLLWPLAHQRIRRYLGNNSRYGNEAFGFHAGPGAFYRPYMLVYGVMIGLMVLVGVAMALLIGRTQGWGGQAAAGMFGIVLMVYLLGLLLVTPYLTARLQNLIWNNTNLGPIGFESHLRARDLLGIMLSNLVLVLLTLGLFKPFADIRMARYRLQSMALQANAPLDEFVAGVQVDASATGEEMAEMFDFDIAL